ncbi:hypothetical protein [Arthrobacter cavernae]|uniref:Uncharacterized protein n=1 Tax=Arthrobacter cavernae TaxID=2817681 RepID=A0A939HM13_9MICC|nr:hypothetical protein [Arthrobacter cavernae]MBO1269825.1 hypothetical protein [Arthrobacter cavernae]
MTSTTRERFQDIALAALVIFNVCAAFLVATNPFSAAAFIGSAIICLAVLVSTALIGKNPKVWEPRIGPNRGRRILYAVVVVVAVLFILGLTF